MRILPCGDRALLLDCADPAERRRWDAVVASVDIPGLIERVPASRTILVRFEPGVQLSAAAAALAALSPDAAGDRGEGSDDDDLIIETRYDGEDLAEAAALVGWGPEELIAWHTGQTWTVDFVGFLPGFGYLVGDESNPSFARRATPRPRIPAGAVGLAGQFTGAYPHPSPGGWQLIGTTAAPLWDVERRPPALFVPGRRVRFVEIDHG